jgi:antitoxin component YwqK of YwqJK toxin-antitoxin module
MNIRRPEFALAFYLICLCSCVESGSSDKQKTAEDRSTFIVHTRDSARIDKFDNDTIKGYYQIKAGKMHGAFLTFFRNGKPNEIGIMRKGLKSDVWKQFDSSGRLIGVDFYKDNITSVALFLSKVL